MRPPTTTTTTTITTTTIIIIIILSPEKPNNVKLKETPPYQFNSSSHEMCDLIVTWDPPQHRRHRNYISNYTLSYRKAPDMHNADVIQPHRGTIPLPPVRVE